VAGAEYLTPLLNKWKKEGRHDWKVLSSPVSSTFLTRHDLPHEVISSCSDEIAKSWIDRISPDSALVSTAMDSALESCFVRELTRRRITCAQLIDNWVNLSRRFQITEAGGTFSTLLPDWILTLDETAKTRMVAEGLPLNKIRIIGQPHWESCLQKSREESVKPGPGLALMVTQPISHFYGKSLGYDQFDFVRCCVKSWDSLGIDLERLHLLIHPSEDVSSYDDLLAQGGGKKIQIVQNSTLRLKRYSLVMGMFTSVLIQCLIERVPALSVQPGAIGEDRCFLSENGFIPRSLSNEELTPHLHKVLSTFQNCHETAARFESIVEGSLARLEAFLDDF
jgi:hypothetical protein